MATMSISISGVSLADRIAASTYLRGLAATECGRVYPADTAVITVPTSIPQPRQPAAGRS
jgi:hypothetical protein